MIVYVTRTDLVHLQQPHALSSPCARNLEASSKMQEDHHEDTRTANMFHEEISHHCNFTLYIRFTSLDCVDSVWLLVSTVFTLVLVPLLLSLVLDLQTALGRLKPQHDTPAQ